MNKKKKIEAIRFFDDMCKNFCSIVVDFLVVIRSNVFYLHKRESVLLFGISHVSANAAVLRFFKEKKTACKRQMRIDRVNGIDLPS